MSLPPDSRPIAFVLTADRPRALAFYTQVLDLPLQSEDAYGAVLDGRGIELRLTDIEGHEPSAHPVFSWQVPDIAAMCQALRAAGVECLIYPGFGQDSQGVWSSPDGGTKLAWFADPDGNVLGLSQKG